MAYAIQLFLDEETSDEVQRCWGRLATLGFTHMNDSGYYPHITLMGTGDLNQELCIERLSELAKTNCTFPVQFPCISFFPTERPTIFLGIIPNDRIISLHREMYKSLRSWSTDVSEYYTPENWLPHCTLAFQVPRSEILNITSECMRYLTFPRKGMVTEIAMVELLNGSIIWKEPLREINSTRT